MFLAKGVELGTVQSSKGDFLVSAQLLCSRCILWLGCLAVTTPWSVEHHETVLLLLERGLKGLVCEMVDLYNSK